MCNGYNWSDRFTLREADEQGVPARHPNKEQRNLNVHLGEITFNFPPNRNFRGQPKPYSQEDVFMMNRIQPAAHGAIVRNEYFLAVRTSYEGCTCCASTPLARVPLVIIPLVNPKCYGFQVPPTFQAQPQPMVQFNLNF